MRFAVIAAGEGSRLAQEGVEQPKPLVPVCGEPMIERLLRIFVDCGATEIVVIVNEWSTAVREHLEQMKLPVPLRLVVKTTPSSMHSLHALSPYLRGERFCLTTVDTIFREEEFKKYIRHFQEAKDIDGCMAVTPYVMMKNRCGLVWRSRRMSRVPVCSTSRARTRNPELRASMISRRAMTI